ncbi:MAG: hypothetical protein M0C28_32325 [Candidatus Moduliflexus flocculans]|nr:hypothetical protein [Candidatus Moduliflexus flocculans]
MVLAEMRPGLPVVAEDADVEDGPVVDDAQLGPLGGLAAGARDGHPEAREHGGLPPGVVVEAAVELGALLDAERPGSPRLDRPLQGTVPPGRLGRRRRSATGARRARPERRWSSSVGPLCMMGRHYTRIGRVGEDRARVSASARPSTGGGAAGRGRRRR